jgi:hypothetical protein
MKNRIASIVIGKRTRRRHVVPLCAIRPPSQVKLETRRAEYCVFLGNPEDFDPLAIPYC